MDRHGPSHYFRVATRTRGKINECQASIWLDCKPRIIRPETYFVNENNQTKSHNELMAQFFCDMLVNEMLTKSGRNNAKKGNCWTTDCVYEMTDEMSIDGINKEFNQMIGLSPTIPSISTEHVCPLTEIYRSQHPLTLDKWAPNMKMNPHPKINCYDSCSRRAGKPLVTIHIAPVVRFEYN